MVKRAPDCPPVMPEQVRAMVEQQRAGLHDDMTAADYGKTVTVGPFKLDALSKKIRAMSRDD